MSSMVAEPITPPQEPQSSNVNTEMDCLLTTNEDTKPPTPTADNMSGFINPYYTNNGEGSSAGRERQNPQLFTGARGRALTAADRVPISAINPGPVLPTLDQLNVAYGYGIQREDGHFTRLIRADQLPSQVLASLSVPERQGSEGLILVPAPRQPSPSRRVGPLSSVGVDVVARLPVFNPHGPYYAPSSTASGQACSFQTSLIPLLTTPKANIDQILAAAGSPPSSFRLRKEKVYCDKWLHDGVCAFTQMGCRYKHEMPMDRATQIALGLNHGLPQWYRRLHAVALGAPPSAGLALPPPPSPQPAAPAPAPANTGRIYGNWRREPALSAHPGPLFGPGPFGPIAPPAPAYRPAPSPPNPASLVRAEEEEREVDEILFRGRRG